MHLVPLAAWLVIGVQVFGIGSAWIARMSIGTVLQNWWQSLFFGSLMASGATTFVSVLQSSSMWIFSASAMCVMVLTALLDFQPGKRKS